MKPRTLGMVVIVVLLGVIAPALQPSPTCASPITFTYASDGTIQVADPSITNQLTIWTVDAPAATDPTLAIEFGDETAIPEPATLLLLGTAMTACGISLRRRRA